MTEGQRTLVCIGTLLTVGMIAYANCFSGTYIDYDDHTAIRDNPQIEFLWPLARTMALPPYHAPVGSPQDGRPFYSVSLALNRALLGHHEWSYHLVSLAMHLGTAVLLFAVLRRTLQGEGLPQGVRRARTAIALATAMLWCVHPLNTQAVMYLCQRSELQMGLLYLATLYCAMRGFARAGKGRYIWYTGAVTAAFIGMGTKPVMVSVPLAIFLYDAIFVSASFGKAWRARRGFYVALFGTWTLIGYLLYANASDIQRDFASYEQSAGVLEYAFTQPAVILTYLGKAVWPAKLVFARYTARPEGQIAAAAPWVLLTLWFAVSCLGIWRRRWYGFVGAWFFMILAPSSSIYPQMMCNYYQEHRMYLSLAAVILLGVLGGWWVVHHLAQHVGAQWRVHALALACMAALTGVCVVATRVRVTDYHSVLAMTLSRVRAQPEGRHHWRELAAVHWHEGRPSNTLAALRQGTTCVPEPVGLYMQLGAYCMELGLTQDALQAYVAGADVCTNRAPLLQEAGHVALQAECYETARDHFEAARACRGDDVKTLIGLRAAYAALGEHAQAERFNRLALHTMLTNMPGHVRQNMGAPIQEHNEQP